jgi:hypothetical protein
VEEPYTLSLLRLAQFSHALEIDAYPVADQRPAASEELPPGIAIVSFCSRSARTPVTTGNAREGLQLAAIGYDGAFMQVRRGKAGEILELIECTQPLESAAARAGKNLH